MKITRKEFINGIMKNTIHAAIIYSGTKYTPESLENMRLEIIKAAPAGRDITEAHSTYLRFSNDSRLYFKTGQVFTLESGFYCVDDGYKKMFYYPL